MNDDLISRQAAIDAVKALENDSFDFNNGLIAAMNVIGELPSAQPSPENCWGCNCPKMVPSAEPEPEEFEWCTGCKEYDQEAHCCHRWTKVIRNTVEEIKNAQSEPRWVPVTERLPEIGEKVLVSTKYTVFTQVFKRIYGTPDRWGWEHNTIKKVTAWMPLPEPWKGEADA